MSLALQVEDFKPKHLMSMASTVQVSITSSPAVAERPRDASSLSVASIVQYVERNLLLLVIFSSDLPLHAYN